MAIIITPSERQQAYRKPREEQERGSKEWIYHTLKLLQEAVEKEEKQKYDVDQLVKDLVSTEAWKTLDFSDLRDLLRNEVGFCHYAVRVKPVGGISSAVVKARASVIDKNPIKLLQEMVEEGDITASVAIQMAAEIGINP